MPNLEVGEPLLSDERLSGIAARLVVEFPQLQDSDFVTWVQEPKEMIGEGGLATKLPEVAVFAVRTGDKLTKGAAYLRDFETDDRVDPTTAVNIFRAVAREHARILGALEGLIDGSQSRTVLGSDV